MLTVIISRFGGWVSVVGTGRTQLQGILVVCTTLSHAYMTWDWRMTPRKGEALTTLKKDNLKIYLIFLLASSNIFRERTDYYFNKYSEWCNKKSAEKQ